jgi:hypothetical protein
VYSQRLVGAAAENALNVCVANGGEIEYVATTCAGREDLNLCQFRPAAFQDYCIVHSSVFTEPDNHR